MKYYNFTDSMSSEPSEYRIPPHWSDIDYTINLTNETKPVFSSIYNLSENKLKVLKEYIKDYLRKEFIQEFILFFESLDLFTKKPDKSLHPYIDYRALNHIMAKNYHPLLLIHETLNRLYKVKYFTKIDLLSAFN